MVFFLSLTAVTKVGLKASLAMEGGNSEVVHNTLLNLRGSFRNESNIAQRFKYKVIETFEVQPLPLRMFVSPLSTQDLLSIGKTPIGGIGNGRTVAFDCSIPVGGALVPANLRSSAPKLGGKGSTTCRPCG